MANSDKNIVITPNIGQTAQPSIVFTGQDAQDITLSVLDSAGLSISGASGQLFSVIDDATGTIFSVNDVSGIPSLEVDDDGTIRLAEFAGNVLIGTATDNGTDLLQVDGSGLFNAGDTVYSMNSTPSLTLGVNTTAAGTLKLWGGTSGSYSLIQQTTNNLHIDTVGGDTYLNFYDGNTVRFGNGAGAVVAVMGPDGDLWKGSADNTGSRYFHDGYHPNADKWTTARTLSLTGDVTGSVSWDGSGNASLTATVVDNSHNHSSITSGGSDITSNSATWTKNNGEPNVAGQVYAAGTGDARFMFHSGSGKVNIYADGQYYANEGNYLVWNQGNDGSGSGLDADLLDGSHGTYFNHRLYTDDTNYLGGYYVSGGSEKPNDAIFGAGKLKIAMLSGSNLGFGGTWNDVLWMSTYNGSDVKPSWAIVGDKYSDNIYVSRQNYDSATWGTGHKLWHAGNDGSGSGLDADLLDGVQGSSFLRSDATDTATGALTFSNGANYYNGHFYYTPYDANGNHYPHFTDGANANGVDINWRLFTGATNTHTHTWNTTAATFVTQLHSTVDMRAPIFYDYNDTAYYVDPASTGTSLQIAGTIEQGNNYAHPNIEWSASGSSTGEVIFYLPGTTSNYGMVHMVFDIYEYNSPRVATVTIGGHNWSTSWYNYACNVVGYTDKSVRLGVKNGRFCVIFGATTSTWTYGQIRLRKIQNGSYYNNIMDLGGNWSTELTTTESFSSVTGDLRNLRTPASLEVDNIIYGYGSVRSPIFYDYNDTGYYVDPNSTSRINGLENLGRAVIGGRFDYNAYNTTTGARLHFGGGDSDANGNYYIGTNLENYGGNYNKLDLRWHTGIRMGAQASYGGTRIFSDEDMTTLLFSVGKGDGNTRVESGNFYAPIMYDINDTSYYVDPNSTSNMYQINIWNDVEFKNKGQGITGTYDSYALQGVFNMGDAYKLSSDGSTAGNLYGIAWSHPNAGTKGGANNLASHGMLILENGSFKGAWGGGRLVTPADIRGTIFYDYNNTGYYVDPASTAYLNVIGAAGRIYTGYDSGVANSVSCSNWFRSNGSSGWYNDSYGGGIYMIDASWVRVYNNKGFYTAGEIQGGNINTPSDERIKKDIVKIENPLEKLKQINGYNFTYKKTNKPSSGVIAQEVQKVMPQLVHTSADGDTLTVEYGNMVGLLIEAIKEQDNTINTLRDEISQLKELVKQLMENK